MNSCRGTTCHFLYLFRLGCECGFLISTVMIWKSVDRLSGKDRYRPSSLGFVSFLEDLGAGHQGTNLTPRLLVHVLLYTDFTDAYVQLQVTCSTDADRT